MRIIYQCSICEKLFNSEKPCIEHELYCESDTARGYADKLVDIASELQEILAEDSPMVTLQQIENSFFKHRLECHMDICKLATIDCKETDNELDFSIKILKNDEKE